MPRKPKTRTVGIEINNQRGEITWDLPKTKNVKFSVDFPDNNVKDSIIKHLNKKQEFWIPESQRIDDYRIENEYPVKSPMYFSLALCTLHNDIGVYVHWKK